jgi:hypothetical protein
MNLLSRLRLGLRQRFLLAVFLAVISALGLILFNAAEGRRLVAEQSERSAVQWSGVIANYQRDLERQARTLVAVLARDPALFTAGHAGCNKHFADLLFNAVKEPDNFFNFVAADLNGNIYCSARQATAGNMHIRDRVGRWGGEEFLVVCPDTDIVAAQAVAEKLRQRFASHAFPVMENMTGSFGVASLGAGEVFDAVTSRADAALYRTKHNGRNKVEIGS